MKTNTSIGSILLLVFLMLPGYTYASASASVGALLPGATVIVDTHVTFSVIASGFSNPIYTVVDSFGGGVNNRNIDSSGNLSWTPNNSDIGVHTIAVTVSDSQGNSASASQTIAVITPNVTVGPVSPAARIVYGTPITFTLGSSGYISPQYSVADSFANSSMSTADTNSASGVFSWMPTLQDVGTHTLIVAVHDYLGNGPATTSQQIVVVPPASVQILSVVPGTTAHVGDSVSFDATTTGFVQPSFTVADAFTSTLGTSSLAIDQNGRATWVPVSNDFGTHPITVSATDALGDSASTLVRLMVFSANPTSAVPAVVPYIYSATSSLVSVTTQTQPSAPAPYTFKKYLAIGSSGGDVVALQRLLLRLGFYAGPVTGYFGKLTKGGVQNYQRAHNISVLGIVGPMTRAVLNTGR